MIINLQIELELSNHLDNTSFIDDEFILESNKGLLLLHSNVLGCNVGKVTIVKKLDNNSTKLC